MKRHYLIVFFALISMNAMAQSEVQSEEQSGVQSEVRTEANVEAKTKDEPFMTKFKKLVEQIEQIDNKNYFPVYLDSLRNEYSKLTSNFDETKRTLSNEELAEYHKYKARYQKKIALVSTKRGLQTAKGWIKGAVGKD